MTADPSVWRVKGMPLAPATGHGPLDGLRVAVKDLFEVTGFAVGGGNPAWLASALPAAADAPAVARLRAAGAVVQGIVHTDELAYSLSGTNAHYGTPPNPAAPHLVTGGSSSGPASAVATGHADIGLGTDTGGSIRVPASCCGLYGLRPTHGAVPTEGVLPLAPSFDTVGWITAGAATLALVGSVLLPGGPANLPSRLLTVDGAPPCDGFGLPVSRVTLSTWDDPDPLLLAFRQVQAAEAWRAHGAWITAHPRTLAVDVEDRFRFGAGVTAGEEAAARAYLARQRAELLDLLADRDAWLVLPAGGPGHPRDLSQAGRDAWRRQTLRCAVPASAYGLPSIAVPAGTDPPAGIAVIAPPGHDHGLLALASRPEG